MSQCRRWVILLGLISITQWGAQRSFSEEPWSADPQLVEKLMQKSGGFNYRESEVPEYTLPEALRFESGDAVSAEQWPQRREELMELFRQHVYGQRPELDYQVRFDVESQREGVFDGTTDARQVRIRIVAGEHEYAFSMLVFMPTGDRSGEDGKLPAIVHLNNREFPTLESVLSEPSDFWPVAQICEQGFVAASVSTHQIDPDKKGHFDEGIRGFFAKASGGKIAGSNAAGEAADEHAWGALSAWGWGVSRAVDYLETLDAVDSQRIAVVGHSRGGKAALWATAEDPRLSIAYSNNSGCGGAALSRRQFGETVARITNVFPHWFCGKFSEYSNRESELPVDQHQLIGLIAPRAVYVTSATEDLWADPRGEYLSLINAAPVFELLGVQAISEESMPAADQPRVRGNTGYHIRSGGHGLTAFDWQHFMDFVKSQSEGS